MKHVIYTDPDQCRRIWEKTWPVKGIFDLWQVRSCFQDAYLNPFEFHTIEKNGRIVGFLPLSWNDENGRFVLFPGETWKGKTWLEQNRIIAENQEILRELLDLIPGPMNLRYLDWSPIFENFGQLREDEIGYLFYPGLYDFSFENYWLGFSGKSRKKIKAELDKYGNQNITFRFNEKKDIEHLFDMNRKCFCGDSYFDDPRFYDAFERLASYLDGLSMLRITTILIGGEIAAVDMGGIFNNTYTLFAGGTNPEFKGVAKMINLHHMEWSCIKRFDVVDFLCGDFNWKQRFHLSPRPLYEISSNKHMALYEWKTHEREAVCA